MSAQHRFDEPYITGVIEQAKLFDVGRTRCGSLSGILLFFYMRDTLFEPGGRVLPTTPLPLDRPREARQRNSHLLFASAYLNADGSGYRLSRHYAASEAISMHLDEYEEEVVTVEATLAFIERDHKPKPRITKIDQPASDRVGSIMTGLTHAECPASLIAGSGSSSDDTSRLLDQFDLLVTVPQNIDRDELLVQLTYLRQDNGICAAALPVHGDDTYARVVINIDRLRSERYDARTFHYGYTDTQIRNGELRTTILNTFKGPGDVVLVLRELYPILRGDFAAVVMDHPAFYQFFRGYVYATTEFCREKTVGKAHRTSLRRADTGTQVGRTLIYSEALTPFVGNAVWGVAAPLIGNMFATEAQITSDVRALIDVRGCGSAAFARIEDYILAQTWFLQQDRR
ncbi:MAG: hypothetical protein H6993_09905 [Pseudomonadales bacterium]|nr:hypothetical protein [Pseudomonadales bacterium]MCP5184266.1 hypothetical protein [Pseudomonadales bacterium]